MSVRDLIRERRKLLKQLYRKVLKLASCIGISLYVNLPGDKLEHFTPKGLFLVFKSEEGTLYGGVLGDFPRLEIGPAILRVLEAVNEAEKEEGLGHYVS